MILVSVKFHLYLIKSNSCTYFQFLSLSRSQKYSRRNQSAEGLVAFETAICDKAMVAANASDDAELLASTRENGIKQNLIIHALSDVKFAVDAGGRRLTTALHFLMNWPALEQAAALITNRATEIDGQNYELFGPASDVLEDRYPLAATLLKRGLVDFALQNSRVKRYRHTARHLRVPPAFYSASFCDTELLVDGSHTDSSR